MLQSQDYSDGCQSLACKHIPQVTTSDACQLVIAWCHNRRLYPIRDYMTEEHVCNVEGYNAARQYELGPMRAFLID